MEDNKKQDIDRELEMEKILGVNQLDDADIKGPITGITTGNDQKKFFFKNLGFIKNLGTYGGLGNSKGKKKLTIALVIIFILTITSATIIRHTFKIYSIDVYTNDTNDGKLHAGDMRINMSAKVRLIDDNVTVLWYDIDGTTVLCEEVVSPIQYRLFQETLHSSCSISNWIAGDYKIEYLIDDEVFQNRRFKVLD